MQKECVKHGQSEFVQEKSGYFRCKKCRSESVTRNRQTRKKKLIEYFGGKCQICNYDKCAAALDFHHLNPDDKEFAISEFGVCRSWDRMLTEAKKCILVCCRCHKEIESGLYGNHK
jgi:hypothetical protein